MQENNTMYSKLLGDIVKEGMSIGYAPEKALEIYNTAQKKVYERVGKLTLNRDLFLDKKAYDVTSRYFKMNPIEKGKDIIKRNL